MIESRVKMEVLILFNIRPFFVLTLDFIELFDLFYIV